MIEALNNSLSGRQRPLRRNDSFSTVSSSVAAADIMHQYANLNNKVSEKPISVDNNPTNVQFRNSEGVHVGNVVYHIHHHQPKNETKQGHSDSFDSLSNSENLENPPNFLNNLKEIKKRIWIIGIGISICAIFAAVGVSTYFLLRHKEVEILTTTTEEPEITTREPNIELPENYVTRAKWGAEEPKSQNIPKLYMPIKRIIIGHTGGQFCTNQSECINIVKLLQFQDSSHVDIPYNFLIGGDGRIYEGRGFNYTGQHTQNKDATEYNSIGICIAFIGNYQTTPPSSSQIEILVAFIEHFRGEKLIAQDHIKVSQDDLKHFPTKATALNDVVRTFQNFRPLYKIYRREEWSASAYRGEIAYFNRSMNWILIGHTVTPLCKDLNACMSRARSLQQDSFSRPLEDILYNIFFGGDGFAFEGRGWDIEAAHAKGFNDKTIGVGVIGDFTSVPPDNNIINAILRVFDDALALGKLTEDYIINGRSDFGDPGPGAAFMQIIRNWGRYGNRTRS